MDMTTVLDPRYTTSVNCIRKTLLLQRHKITKFEIVDTKNSFTAHAVMYELIT